MSTIRELRVLALLVLAIPAALPAQETLSAPGARITDEAIARDRATLAAWTRRLDSLDAAGNRATAYTRAKARAWLELVRTEYSDNDRTGIVESGFAAATALIRGLEAGQPTTFEVPTPMVPGSQRVLDSLWERAERRKQDPDAAEASDAGILAALEIELIWAGNEALTCGPFDARPHEDEARRLAALLLTYQPPPPPAPPPPPPAALPPAVDSDGDGVFDSFDRCPGTRPGVKVDAKGCALLVVEDTVAGRPPRPLVLRGVNFETGRADLKAESFVVLDDVAASLLANEDVRIEIAGHTDDQGAASFNLVLSNARAGAVRDYLVFKGVAADRMTARGYGEEQPIAANTTRAGRALNRRVELHRLP